ncbi:MAG TPA: DUF1573 domain-containing protein [Chitinophagaceae bacterium]|nr:DUF1573 domain-containing protein [Chitinophagaceae bacterium]HMZ46876.1 DUF1573 domain-containing protein [Chitinophagaceae bacterium]HNE94204.1 DUF1573 domain-containing protein [Chitinophagaceae bacterium]HNM34141.1 DUF1573 domain-containing protein [Chitinophagaceae bacterium]HNN31511.1 DUF1573 domain-containing protein [Chitinophagaceae bacterium]
MKKIALFTFIALFSIAVNAQQQKTNAPAETTKPQPKDVNKVLEFKNAEYNFGKIPFGKPADYELSFKNVSNDTVTLVRVQVSCGCTSPKYKEGQKIAPGETGHITLGFNGSTNGVFTKFVTVFFNDNMSKQVLFKGETYQTPDTSAPANGGVQKMKTGGK